MRSISVAVVLVVVAGSSAQADDPIVVRAALGIAADRAGSRFDSITRFGPTIQGDVAYRFMDQLAAGVRFGITRNWERDLYDPDPGNMPGSPGGYRWHEVYTSFQLGVGVHWSRDRFWLAPWLGIDDRGQDIIDVAQEPALSWSKGNGVGRQLAFGLGAGVDLHMSSRHRVGAYLDLSRGQHSVETPVYGTIWYSNLYISVGVAYRYW